MAQKKIPGKPWNLLLLSFNKNYQYCPLHKIKLVERYEQ